MAIRIPIITTFDKRGVNNALRNIDGLARQAGKAAGVLAGGVAVGIGASVREFAKFDEALNQSLAIMGDVTDTMRGEMSDAAREVAKTTTFSAEQAAESFFFLASAGLDAEQSVAALPQVAQFAQAGMFDMATATDLATDAQSALGLASDDAGENLDNLTRVTDVFVAANTLANTSVEQLATALTTKAGNALKTVGKDVEEGAAALAVFADQGIKGERAGTLLTNTIFGLTDIMAKAPEEAEKLGIEVFNAAGEMNSFADISEDLTEALSSMTKEQQIATLDSLGFTKQAREGTLALMGQSESLREYEGALRNAGGTAEQVATNQLDTFNAKLSLLGSAVTDVALDIGADMAPKIEELIGVVERLLPKIGDQLIEILDQIDFEQVFEGISKLLNFIADNIQHLDELIIGLATFAAGLTGFTTAVRIATVATTAFGLSLRALPFIGAIAAAVSALTVALGAHAIANQDARTEQEKFNDDIVDTRKQLEFYRAEQAKSTNSSKLYESVISDLEAQLREQRAAQASANEFTKEAEAASYASRDASIANRMASNDLIPALDGTRDSYNEMAFAATNAELGVTSLTIAEEAQRRMQEQFTGAVNIKTLKTYEEILLEVTAGTIGLTEKQKEFNEEARQLAIEMGRIVPGMEDADQSARNLTGSNEQLAGSYSGVTGEINNATDALNRLKNATPGAPGPGGLFEAVFPDGSTRLVNIEGEEFRGLSSGGQQLGRTASGATSSVGRGSSGQALPTFINPETNRKIVGNIQGDRVQELLDEGFEQVELAKGGIVMKPTRALIGEAGPEAVVPLDRAGGFGKTENTININVTTGVGTDPVATGRAVVDAIKRYEATNGKVFVTA
jgi:TP901 family phage tail tape measure protein